MRLFFGAVVWCMFWAWIGVLFNGCAHDDKREKWQDCAGIHHTVCAGDLACEYVLYKECIKYE